MKHFLQAFFNLFSKAEHNLLSHHPLGAPLSLLGLGWVPLLVAAPEDSRWLVVAFAFNGVLQIGGSWLLLRQYIGHLFMGGQSFNAIGDRVVTVEKATNADRNANALRFREMEKRIRRTERLLERVLGHALFQTIRTTEDTSREDD